MQFCGTDVEPRRDRKRLTTQHKRTRDAALAWPGAWFTMSALAASIDEPAASVERQIRYLRSPDFGRYRVDKRHRGGGTFEYRVLPPVPAGGLQGSLFEAHG